MELDGIIRFLSQRQKARAQYLRDWYVSAIGKQVAMYFELTA